MLGAWTVQKRIDEQLPRLKDKFTAFAEQSFTADGALQQVTKELVAMAVAAVGRSERAKEEHAEKARKLGATDDQIAEALSVGWGQTGGTQVFWMKEDLDDLLGDRWRSEFIPEADRRFWAFKREIFSDGALSERIKQLIALAVSSKLRCRHCTVAHIQAALKAGASKAEVAETLGVLWAVACEGEIVSI